MQPTPKKTSHLKGMGALAHKDQEPQTGRRVTVKKHKAESDDLKTPDIRDANQARLAVEVVAHMLLVKNRDAGFAHVARNTPVFILDPELALLSTDKTFQSPERRSHRCRLTMPNDHQEPLSRANHKTTVPTLHDPGCSRETH